MKICGTCGTTNSTNAKACNKCGTLLMSSMSQLGVKIPRKSTHASRKKQKKKKTIKKASIPKKKTHKSVEKENHSFNKPQVSFSQPDEQIFKPIPMTNTNPVGGFFNQPKAKNFPLQSIPPSTNISSIIVPQPTQRKILKKSSPKKSSPKKTRSKKSKKKTLLPKISKLPTKKIASKTNNEANIQRINKKIVKNKEKEHISSEMKSQDKKLKKSKKSINRTNLELEMSEAMENLQKDMNYIFKPKKLDGQTNKKPIIQSKIKVPNSLNEILVNLADLDLNIEASALVDINGSILASAVSRRISKYLIGTIGKTLGNISQDMIHSLDAGDLKFISLQGTQGILFLAPVLKNIFLLLLTGPGSKSGVINIAKIRCKKQLETFYAKRNLKKTSK